MLVRYTDSRVVTYLRRRHQDLVQTKPEAQYRLTEVFCEMIVKGRMQVSPVPVPGRNKTGTGAEVVSATDGSDL